MADRAHRERSRSPYEDSYSSDSASSASSHHPPEEPKVRLAQIFIIKVDPDTECIISILPWDGRDPGDGRDPSDGRYPRDGYSILLAYGVKVSDTTYDSYTPTTEDVNKLLDKLRQFKNSRTVEPTRCFEHMRGTYPSGDSFSILFGGRMKLQRKLNPYQNPNAYGREELFRDSALIQLMKKISRYKWYRDNFKIYASTELNEDGRPKSCWYLVNGPDRWDEHSPYIKVVNASEVPLADPCDITKKYRVLYNFTPDRIEKILFERECKRRFSLRTIHFTPAPAPAPVDPPGGGSKSRRRLKRSFKRKTIKRINKRNKRKTIKRRFKKR